MNTAQLQNRLFLFAQRVRNILKSFPPSDIIQSDRKQLIRASGSIGANYIEACEALSKEDFIYRIRLCRKEAKEAAFWINVLQANTPPQARAELDLLSDEIGQLIRIFVASAKTLETKNNFKKQSTIAPHNIEN